MAVVHSDEFTTDDFDSGRELVRVPQIMPEHNCARISVGTFPHHFHKFLPYSR